MYLSIDFETFSRLDLRQTGVYPYALHESTGILCMSYSWIDDDDGFSSEVRTWVPVRGEKFPTWVRSYVEGGGKIRAWNANFERVLWALCGVAKYGMPLPDRDQFYCTMADAAALALPQALGTCANALGMAQKKDVEGHRLMMSMCKPRKNGTFWHEDPDEGEGRLDRLVQYCEQDVRTEAEIHSMIKELSPAERRIYLLDQKINDRGVGIDLFTVQAARSVVQAETKRANAELKRLTDGDVTTVNKVADMKAWLQLKGVELDDLRKDTVRDLLGEDFPPDVRRVIELRAEVAKSSTQKLKKMEEYASVTGRAHGMLQYHGASTGRWAGRGPQPQNLPRPEIQDPEMYLPAIQSETVADLRVAPPLVVVSSCLRAMFKSRGGTRFMSADFSQIEARVLAWLAGQRDLVNLFAAGGLVYEDMASKIYKVLVDNVTGDQRQIGKMAILGAGFGMGWKTFIRQTKKMTGIELEEEEARFAIDTYRETNGAIQKFWWDLEAAAMHAITNPGSVTEISRGKIRFVQAGQFLWCRLPSGRKLAYALPRIEQREKPWGDLGDTITYMGMNGYTRKWERLTSYGGHLAENVVQAHARDLMAEAMLRVEGAGYPVVLTVHDEVLCEVPSSHGSMEEFISLMTEVPEWSAGVPVAADGWEGERYRK